VYAHSKQALEIKHTELEHASAQANDRLITLEQKLDGGDLVTSNDFAKLTKQNALLGTRLDDLDALLMGGRTLGDEVEALKEAQAGLQATLNVEMQAVGAVLGRQMRLTGAYGAVTPAANGAGYSAGSSTGAENKDSEAALIDVLESGLDGVAQCAKCENDTVSDEQVLLTRINVYIVFLGVLSVLFLHAYFLS